MGRIFIKKAFDGGLLLRKTFEEVKNDDRMKYNGRTIAVVCVRCRSQIAVRLLMIETRIEMHYAFVV